MAIFLGLFMAVWSGCCFVRLSPLPYGFRLSLDGRVWTELHGQAPSWCLEI